MGDNELSVEAQELPVRAASPENAEPEASAEFLAARLPEITDWVDRCRSYYTGTVTVKNAIYWLLQFGSLRRVQLAYRLFRRIDFITEARLTHLLQSAFSALPERERQNLLFCPVGKAYDSALHVSYPFSKALGMREEELAARWISVDGLTDVLRGDSDLAIGFLDDNCTSGTQFLRFMEELTSDAHAAPEHVLQRLPTDAVEQLRTRSIRFLVAVDLVQKPSFEETVMRRIGLADFRLVAGLGSYGSALDFGSGIWLDPADAEAALLMLTDIGKALYADKQWDPSRVRDRVVGYGNLGKLVVFSHNVPKALPPVFWKFGIHRGRPWFPLFPERAEWQQYRREIETHEPFMDLFATQIDAGHFGRSSPLCRAELASASPADEEGRIVLPDSDLERQIRTHVTRNLKALAHQDLPGYSPYGIGGSIWQPTRDQIVEYNNRVDQYNQAIGAYRRDIGSHVARVGSHFDLTFRIRNEGSAQATDAVLRIELPEGLTFADTLAPLPEPPEVPASPESQSYAYLTALRNPLPDMVDRISRQLDHRESQTYRPRGMVDQGRRFVEVRVGKILQHTFRDVPIQYLRADTGDGEFLLSTQLIYAEANRPVSGSVAVTIVRGRKFHNDVWELLSDDDD